MATASILNHHIARKKPVHEKYQPNSYRVISYEAENWQRPEPTTTVTTTKNYNVIGQASDKYFAAVEHRKNRPNPNHVGFLSQDVRLLNEPVCNVYTDSCLSEQDHWWPSRTSDQPLKKPEHTLDTTVRDDFQYRGDKVGGNTRHSSNPNKVPAHGIAPVNLMREKDGKQRFWKEGISYEHQYNSRTDPQYPIRGKRHGSFVWDRFSQYDVDRMLQHFGFVPDQKQLAKQISNELNSGIQSTTGPKSAGNTKPSSPIRSPVSKSAHPALKSSDPDSTEAQVVEVKEVKPLPKSRTESILNIASQQKLKLPPIAL